MQTVLYGLFLLFFLRPAVAPAQITPADTAGQKSYYILLKDGSYIQGRIIEQKAATYTVRMKNGQLTYVEKSLFRQISGAAPAASDSTAYYTPSASPVAPRSATLSPGQYVVTLTDGTTLRGKVISQDSVRLVLETTAAGTYTVPAAKVLRLERADLARNRSRRSPHPVEGYPNLFPHYLHFTPTAFQAEPGRVYYRNSAIYFNQFDVGITPNWSVGVGFLTPLFPFLVGWVSTKVSVPVSPSVRVGLQGQYLAGAFTLFQTRSLSANYLQGVVSLGTPARNLTVGLGKSFSRDADLDGSILTVALVRKVAPLLTFISENQISIGQQASTTFKLGAGLRLDRERHSFDLSGHLLFNVFNAGYRQGSSVNFAPWASYQLRLGK